MTIAAPAPPTLPAASADGNSSSATIVATQKLPIEKTYTTLDYKIDLTNYQSEMQKVYADPAQASALASAKAYRNNIIWGEMTAIEHVYTTYHTRLFSDKNMISVANDAMTLGLTAASTIAGDKGTKTILSALGTAFAGLGLSIDKNYFAQQSFQILGIAMQTRRDKVRTTIATRLSFCDVLTYPLEEGQRDLVQYFGAGTLDSAVQELQEEAASAKSTATAVANNTPPPPTTFAPPSMCPITPPPPAAQPSFNPPGGVYSQPQNVTISSTPGATIYYTTDGKGPTQNSTPYDGKPIAVTSTVQLQAIATAPGYSFSALGTAAYSISQNPAAKPTFNVPNGTYPSQLVVTITSVTPSAQIYYTTDGSEPATSVTGSTKLYSGPLNVLSTQVIQAIATASGYLNSSGATANYTINLPQADAPKFSPGDGTTSALPIPVTITSAIAGATIFYTVDGSPPATAATGSTKQCDNNPCQVQVTMPGQTTITAVVIASGHSLSPVSSATYTISPAAAPAPPAPPPPAALTFDPPDGKSSTSPITVKINALTGATVYYTIDGTAPDNKVTQNTKRYDPQSPPVVSKKGITIVKAIAVLGGSTSQETDATYTISSQ